MAKPKMLVLLSLFDWMAIIPGHLSSSLLWSIWIEGE